MLFVTNKIWTTKDSSKYSSSPSPNTFEQLRRSDPANTAPISRRTMTDTNVAARPMFADNSLCAIPLMAGMGNPANQELELN